MFDTQEIAAGAHEAWFKRAQSADTKHLFIFEIDGEATGFMNLSLSGKDGHVAEWGFYVAPGSARGTGRRLGVSTLNYAFDTIALHKVYGQVLAFNHRSIRFHEALGFAREGLLREHHFNGSEYLDVISFGLLSNEWEPRAGAKSGSD
jgi:UDP-4-amino-4,6-dideoxy-N-acetyl-beta-L-altrosamine N-acetyltransferase